MATAELIERLTATPKTVARLVVAASDEQLDAAADGEWPARTILAHLRDNESLVGRLRIERMLAENNPDFVLLEPEQWVAHRSRQRDGKRTLLADFALHRQATVNLLLGLRREDWARTGRHPLLGTITLEGWATIWLEHDVEHLVQLERTLDVSAEPLP